MQAIFARVRLLTAFLMLLAGAPALQAQPISEPAEVIPEHHFTHLAPPVPIAAGDRIEVIEFFYYGCPVCYEAQPHIARWLQKSGNDVVLRRVPAVNADGWEPFARSFYTLEAMGLLERLHWPVYDNFHFDGKRLNEEEVMADWITSNGGDGGKFRETWNSAEIKAKGRRGTRDARHLSRARGADPRDRREIRHLGAHDRRRQADVGRGRAARHASARRAPKEVAQFVVRPCASF
jgi:thiol:disulfide interchange protein DsbA